MSMSNTWNLVRRLEGETLCTLHRKKQFTLISVNELDVRIVPLSGKRTERSVSRERIERIAGLKVSKEELCRHTRREYPNDQNTSYIAAIVHRSSR